jgi:hypothetical protein
VDDETSGGCTGGCLATTCTAVSTILVAASTTVPVDPEGLSPHSNNAYPKMTDWTNAIDRCFDCQIAALHCVDYSEANSLKIV